MISAVSDLGEQAPEAGEVEKPRLGATKCLDPANHLHYYSSRYPKAG
jgi:hypothetical protein